MQKNRLIDFFVRHYNAANLLMVMMILLGVAGLRFINTQVFPNIEADTISISISWPGATAQDADSNILQVVEPELRFLDGVTSVTSYAREGAASIQLEYAPGTDMQTALNDAEKAVDAISLLPETAESPKVTFRARRDVIARIALSGPFTERALKTYAFEMRDKLLDAGMTTVTFEGLRDEEIEITVPQSELARLDLSIETIANKISGTSLDLPSGTLEGQIDRKLRAVGEQRDVNAYKAIDIKNDPSGNEISIGDIADVSAVLNNDATSVFYNKNPTIILVAQRSLNEDTIQAAALMDETLEEIKPTLPSSLDVVVYDRRSDRVLERIMLLVKNGVSGLVLVLIILFAFLNFRIAFWVAAGIPIALLATLGIMWMIGQTINMISLFALLMMLGIIVDDAIVVGEHTATRLSMGDDPTTAATMGGSRMALPVLAAILTTQAAFGPLLLVQDTIGQIIEALPMVVFAVLTASLIECLLILPGHLRHAGHSLQKKPSWFRRNFDQGFHWVREKPFHFLIKGAYQFRYATVILCIASFIVIAIGLVRSEKVNFVFFPSPEAERITANVIFAPGTKREEVKEGLFQIADTLKEIEKELLQKAKEATLQEEAQPTSIFSKLTNGFTNALNYGSEALFGIQFLPNYVLNEKLVERIFINVGEAGRDRGTNFGEVEVQLVASELRTILTDDISQQWRRRAPKLPGLDRLTIRGQRFGPRGRDIEIEIKNAPTPTLKTVSEILGENLEAFPGVSAVSDSLPFGDEEILIAITPKGEQLGFTTQNVGNQLRDAFEGRIAKRFSTSNEEISIRVRMQTEGFNIASLEGFLLRSPIGEKVPLAEVVNLTEKRGFAIIIREDGRPTVTLTADVDREVNNPDDILENLADEILPQLQAQYNFDYEFGGRNAERAQAFGDVMIGSLIALFIIFIILAFVFSSYLRPIIIMVIIPFGAVGAIGGHAITGYDMSILSIFGLLGLAGILVNDSIILVSRIDERLESGESLATACIEGSKDRLRAVLLTSLTTVGGLFPLLFETSLQAQFLIPMAITLVFGLALATLYVLFLVPAMMGVGGDIGKAFKWLLSGYKSSATVQSE